MNGDMYYLNATQPVPGLWMHNAGRMLSLAVRLASEYLDRNEYAYMNHIVDTAFREMSMHMQVAHIVHQTPTTRRMDVYDVSIAVRPQNPYDHIDHQLCVIDFSWHVGPTYTWYIYIADPNIIGYTTTAAADIDAVRMFVGTPQHIRRTARLGYRVSTILRIHEDNADMDSGVE